MSAHPFELDCRHLIRFDTLEKENANREGKDFFGRRGAELPTFVATVLCFSIATRRRQPISIFSRRVVHAYQGSSAV